VNMGEFLSARLQEESLIGQIGIAVNTSHNFFHFRGRYKTWYVLTPSCVSVELPCLPLLR
jgi:hypothetical protein